ncbi:hypothetical protein P7K49_031435 [Saguinus oedipus]|uniref:B box-type domain-containing protein n=1 Tax=Saguinus oedipus TaxID=9490 RepID=A0ABQ9TZF6_SAGOE|nr:hypothetical protein P7K49_031435 [Saguinus oedipus]
MPLADCFSACRMLASSPHIQVHQRQISSLLLKAIQQTFTEWRLLDGEGGNKLRCEDDCCWLLTLLHTSRLEQQRKLLAYSCIKATNIRLGNMVLTTFPDNEAKIQEGLSCREVLHLYCDTCSVPICRECTMGRHGGHSFIYLQEALQDSRALTIQLLADAQQGRQAIQTKQKKLLLQLLSASVCSLP